MCGRFSQVSGLDQLQDRFDFPAAHMNYAPRYNLSPGQEALAVTSGEQGRRGGMLRWGLVPHWAQEESAGYKMINARAEGIEAKPSFRRPFRRSRCLVPADGFFEWAPRSEGKQPFFLARKDRQPFALAGLWDAWPRPEGGQLKTFTIITVAANRLVKAIHERMPAILAPEDEAAWLDPGQSDPAALHELLRPCPDEWLEAFPVSPRVNSPAQEGPELIEPQKGPGDLFAGPG
ncbi:MAG: SOS response-associated peptidase [Desulfarculus sp.]|jgi:putative SOS response-associated peptidase YedK|nr:MAG: SOS response-associated peptidase [Desulfarculus sp.]